MSIKRSGFTLPEIANAIYTALQRDHPIGHVDVVANGHRVTGIEVPHETDDAYPDPEDTTWIGLTTVSGLYTLSGVERLEGGSLWMTAEEADPVCISFLHQGDHLPLDSVITRFPDAR